MGIGFIALNILVSTMSQDNSRYFFWGSGFDFENLMRYIYPIHLQKLISSTEVTGWFGYLWDTKWKQSAFIFLVLFKKTLLHKSTNYFFYGCEINLSYQYKYRYKLSHLHNLSWETSNSPPLFCSPTLVPENP